MAKKMPAKNWAQRLRPHVKAILLAAAKSDPPVYLSAYQILEQLKPTVRAALYKARTNRVGNKAYVARAPSMEIKDALRGLNVDVVWMSDKGVTFIVDGNQIQPSSTTGFALYFLRTAIKKAPAQSHGVKARTPIKKKVVKAKLKKRNPSGTL